MTAVQSTDVPTGRRPQLAANPIPYWVRDGHVDKSPAVFEEAFADFAAIGFTAVKADVPDGMSAEEYARWISGFGLSPSLSLFSSPFDETINIADEMERAKRFAADQVALGLDRTMVSSMAVPGRMAEPAVGADLTRTGSPWPSRTAGSSARCCKARGCVHCTTPTSEASSKPRPKSPSYSTPSDPT